MSPLKIFVLTALTALSACGGRWDDGYQMISVQTMTGDRELIGADCTLANAKGRWRVTSPGMVAVQRGKDDLRIKCEMTGYVPKSGAAPSSTSTGALRTVVLDGGVGVARDAMAGTVYDYPTPIVVYLDPAGRPIQLNGRLNGRRP